MRRENLNFLIEEKDIISIKYCILFLTTCYSQTGIYTKFTVVAKKLDLSSPITHNFGSLVVK